MMSIGPRPTFKNLARTLEVHIFNFNENIYDQEIELSFIGKIRNVQKFEGVEMLIEELHQDKLRALEIMNK